jgi:hypothetical protein
MVRLAALNDRLNDVRGQECMAEHSPDVPLIKAALLCDRRWSARFSTDNLLTPVIERATVFSKEEEGREDVNFSESDERIKRTSRPLLLREAANSKHAIDFESRCTGTPLRTSPLPWLSSKRKLRRASRKNSTRTLSGWTITRLTTLGMKFEISA